MTIQCLDDKLHALFISPQVSSTLRHKYGHWDTSFWANVIEHFCIIDEPNTWTGTRVRQWYASLQVNAYSNLEIWTFLTFQIHASLGQCSRWATHVETSKEASPYGHTPFGYIGDAQNHKTIPHITIIFWPNTSNGQWSMTIMRQVSYEACSSKRTP